MIYTSPASQKGLKEFGQWRMIWEWCWIFRHEWWGEGFLSQAGRVGRRLSFWADSDVFGFRFVPLEMMKGHLSRRNYYLVVNTLLRELYLLQAGCLKNKSVWLAHEQIWKLWSRRQWLFSEISVLQIKCNFDGDQSVLELEQARSVKWLPFEQRPKFNP